MESHNYFLQLSIFFTWRTKDTFKNKYLSPSKAAKIIHIYIHIYTFIVFITSSWTCFYVYSPAYSISVWILQLIYVSVRIFHFIYHLSFLCFVSLFCKLLIYFWVFWKLKHFIKCFYTTFLFAVLNLTFYLFVYLFWHIFCVPYKFGQFENNNNNNITDNECFLWVLLAAGQKVVNVKLLQQHLDAVVFDIWCTVFP